MLEGLVDKVLDNLMVLMPFFIVHSYERACRWTFGKSPTEMQPGFHWRIYLVHSYEIMPIVDDVIELQVQSVITKDEKLVCFKAIIGYRVVDVVKHYCNVTDFTSATKGVAMGHLAKRVRNQVLAEVVSDLEKLEASCKTTLTTKFKDWGTEVTYVSFIDFAEVPSQIRLFGSERMTLDT